MSRARNARRGIGRLAVVLALALTAAACGDDDSEGSSASDDTAAPSTSAAANGSAECSADDPKPVRLLISAATLGLFDGLVALGAGYFEENGLDIEQLPYLPSSPQSVLATVNGDADIAVTGVDPIFAVRESGREAVLFAVGTSDPSQILTVTQETADRWAEDGVTPDSPVEDRVKAMEGARIASSSVGSTSEAIVRSMMDDFGVPVDDNDFVGIDLAAIGAALRDGQVDVIVAPAPASIQPIVDGWGVAWIRPEDAADIPSWSGTYYTGSVTSREYADANPEVLQCFVRALDQASDLIADDLEAAAEVYHEFAPDLDEELLMASVEAVAPTYSDGPVVDEEGFEKLIALYNQVADQPSDATFEEVFRVVEAG